MTATLHAFSIRESLQGHLQDFVQQTGFECTRTEALVRDVVCLLSAYREEDVPLFPHIYIVDGFESLAAIAPGAERITLGSSPYNADTAKDILKNCAGLAIQGWSVFIARKSPTEFEYGIFRATRHSYSLSAEESLADLGESKPVLMIRNRGHFVVELLISNKRTYTVSFTSSPAAPSPMSTNIAKFSRIASSGLDERVRYNFMPYLERLITDKLLHSHGTLLAVVDKNASRDNHHATLQQGLWLEPQIDLAQRHQSANEEKSALTLADLQASEVLLEGMVNNDGVVVFGTDGRLKAFRVFLKPTDEEKKDLPEKGGGRRRTFELMKSRTGTILKAAFFRSQDGDTDCSGEGE